MRRGADYVAGLRDGRAVFLDGERVADVTSHPAFAEPIRRVAERYDAAREAPEITTCVDPASGRRIVGFDPAAFALGCHGARPGRRSALAWAMWAFTRR